jgi:RHS repeat-associated protein
LNQLTAVVTTGGLTMTNSLLTLLPATVTLSYDADGNLTWDGLLAYTYDGADELTGVILPNGWKTGYVYDGLGRRRIRKDYTWTNSAWAQTNEVHYVYDGMNVIQERNSNNVPLVTYTRGTDFSGSSQGAGGIGGLLARTDANGSAYYHTDGNGNVTALVNGSGTVVAKYLYDSFGNTLGLWGSLAAGNTYRFSSKEIDARTGLYYYGYRWYDPNLQRWLNHDPIGERGGLNLYGFVRNNPVNGIDLLGLAGEDLDVDLVNEPVVLDYPRGTMPEDEEEREIHDLLNGGSRAETIGPLTEDDRSQNEIIWDKIVDAITKASKGKLNQRLGQSGENATCPVKNTERIPSLTGTAKYRTPDTLDHVNGIIGDTKNVQYQAMTDQLRDDQYYAIVNGYEFQLTVRPDTILSSSVVNAVPRITIKVDTRLP